MVILNKLVVVVVAIKPPGGLFISSPFEGRGAYLRGGLIQFKNDDGISSP